MLVAIQFYLLLHLRHLRRLRDRILTSSLEEAAWIGGYPDFTAQAASVLLMVLPPSVILWLFHGTRQAAVPRCGFFVTSLAFASLAVAELIRIRGFQPWRRRRKR